MESVMLKRLLLLCAAVAAVVSLDARGGVADAAQVKVLTSVALTAALGELAPRFEKATGDKLDIVYGLAAEMRKRVLDGESADLILITRPMMEELQKENKLAANSLVDIAGTPVAIGARAGAPKPDISTVDALKRTLLAAKSVAYSDPAKGGVSGVHFARVLERLGIADQMKPKSILVSGALAPELVAKGEAELGVGQGSEIVPVAGVELVGPLPGELASTTVFSAAIGADSKAPAAAKALIVFLTGPQAAPTLKAKGFEPR
jgi:molybdate transport system substrate-binding protein